MLLSQCDKDMILTIRKWSTEEACKLIFFLLFVTTNAPVQIINNKKYVHKKLIFSFPRYWSHTKTPLIFFLYFYARNIKPAAAMRMSSSSASYSPKLHTMCSPQLSADCGQDGTHSPLNTNRRQLYLKTQFVPHSKHFSSRL